MAESKVISNKGKSISILILGDISAWYGANSKILYDSLRNKELEDIQLYISSDGGNLTEALVMYDMLKGHKARVTAHLTGMVASAATIIACASDEVRISKQAVYMVHRASSISFGNANDLKKTAGVLEIFDNKIVEIYSSFIDTRKKGVRKKILWELIDAESFTDHAGALELGLVDSIVDHVAFDFDTAEMDWRYYCSDVEMAASPEQLGKYGGYWNTILKAKGYQYITSKEIKNKNNMKSLNQLFASIVSFLGGKGFLKEEMIEAAKASGVDYEPDFEGDPMEMIAKAAVEQHLEAARASQVALRAEMEAKFDEMQAKIGAIELVNAGLKDENEQLRRAMVTEKNAVIRLEDVMANEIALVKGMKFTKAGNGESITDPVVPLGDEVSADELLFYGAALARGQISAEQYKEITGRNLDG